MQVSHCYPLLNDSSGKNRSRGSIRLSETPGPGVHHSEEGGGEDAAEITSPICTVPAWTEVGKYQFCKRQNGPRKGRAKRTDRLVRRPGL
jgi:hypothetical protein